jgi:hypothetical protein
MYKGILPLTISLLGYGCSYYLYSIILYEPYTSSYDVVGHHINLSVDMSAYYLFSDTRVTAVEHIDNSLMSNKRKYIPYLVFYVMDNHTVQNDKTNLSETYWHGSKK